MAKAFEDTSHTNQWIKNQLHSSKNRRGWNVNICAREEERKDRQKAYRDSLLAKDTRIRLEIHIMIRKMKAEGKTKLEVLIALTKNPEYKTYSQYFKAWIENDYRENPRKSPWTSKTKITPEKEER